LQTTPCLCKPGNPAFWFQNEPEKFKECTKQNPDLECYLPLSSLKKEVVEVFSKKIIDSAEAFCKPFESLPPYSCTGRTEIRTNLGVVASSALSYAQIALTILSIAAVLLLSKTVDRSSGSGLLDSAALKSLDDPELPGENYDISAGKESGDDDVDLDAPLLQKQSPRWRQCEGGPRIQTAMDFLCGGGAIVGRWVHRSVECNNGSAASTPPSAHTAPARSSSSHTSPAHSSSSHTGPTHPSSSNTSTHSVLRRHFLRPHRQRL
jgi:hypothetical protein